MRPPLSIKERFAVAAVYLLLLTGFGVYFSGNLSFLYDPSNRLNALFIVVALALVLGYYLTEPYFTKPVEVIARWIAIFLFLIGLSEKLSLHLYWLIACGVFIFSAIVLIFLHGIGKFEKYQRSFTDLICRLSRPEIVFTLLYFDVVITFFRNKTLEYPILIGFGFLLAINRPVIVVVRFVASQITNFKGKSERTEFLGQIIGYDSPDVYTVELSSDNSHSNKALVGKFVYLDTVEGGILGAVIKERILLGKKWIDVISLRDRTNQRICYDLTSVLPLAGEKTIFSKSNSVYLLDRKLDADATNLINESPMASGLDRLIGCVWEGSTINKIRFSKLFSEEFLRTHSIGEGSIIKTEIAGAEVLYQIIDGRTGEESLEHRDSHSYILGTAQKLGRYDEATKQLNTVKWLPENYTPIFLLDATETPYVPADNIGKLPNSNYGIPIQSPAELVTHNTAILGILGIGKSCLTFELIQKLVAQTEVKVFCIDLTDQYANELPKYVDEALIEISISDDAHKKITAAIKTGNQDNTESWGNIKEYKDILDVRLEEFCNGDKRILTMNPDWHKVEAANAQFKITHNEPLTAAQKARIMSERIFVQARSKGETKDARYLIVFEEAHSLIPEWNSVSHDGDKNAANGTAKVILQGRKYGLGSFIITQRTANISKSVLNQCNTIFSMRIFDDTGKQFLENYIGSDYSNLLPTLEERHCVAIGKALKLKQPVVVELNDIQDVVIK